MSDAEVVVVERTAHSLDALLAPRSVALVGASNRKASSGNEMVLAALSGRPPDGAPGVRIYAVNPAYAEVEGLRCLPSLADLPETVEHVVISVGNARLEAVFAEVLAHGAKAATIFGSGHLEDDTPPLLKGRILAMAREAGIRLCGPNCMGFSNLSLGLHVAAFPFPKDLQPGPIAWIAQSGSVYGALAYNDRRMRFALCASTGAEWDVTAAGRKHHVVVASQGTGCVLEVDGVAHHIDRDEGIAVRAQWPALIVSVAVAANLGGIGTIIGSPPNAIAAGQLPEGSKLSFIGWMVNYR